MLVTQSYPTLWPREPQEPTSLLCPWDSPGKNTKAGSHSLLKGIFPTQGSNLHLLRSQADSLLLSHPGKYTDTCHIFLSKQKIIVPGYKNIKETWARKREHRGQFDSILATWAVFWNLRVDLRVEARTLWEVKLMALADWPRELGKSRVYSLRLWVHGERKPAS